MAQSVAPTGSHGGKIDHVYCWKSTHRNAANAADRGKVDELHLYFADFRDIPVHLPTISAPLPEIFAHKFSFGIHLAATGGGALPAAGLAVRRHLLQNGA
ncbi:hypothetical protein [Bradyrhizobium glycinis]|uniref:hypothetical protein n=1 Tax=Bradyrhizobium glycinis TaxID=2751812 RepID=UPI0018D67393|nr:hypothetical protein [Bradyrhizobium glycinis]MBH5368102.1 hypothetical protein [Bradyrhizobium glycinis]